MKRFFAFLIIIVLVIGVIRGVKIYGGENPELSLKIPEFIEPWMEKAESITDDLSKQFSEQIEDQEWDMKGAYDIDTAGWFEEGETILSGTRECTQLSSGVVSCLVLRSAGCKVQILETEETDFYYSFENMKKIQAYQDGENIVLRAMRETELDKGIQNSVLKLYVPSECYLDNMEIEVGAGSMEADRLRAKTLFFSVEAGKLTVDAVKAETVHADLGAGDLSLNNVNLQNAELSVGAGSMSIEGSITGNIEAECAMGSLQMHLNSDVRDYNYEVQCVAGNIQIGEDKFSGVNEEKRIDNAAEDTMELDCAMGSMIIGFDAK